jgi:hypothetical protein
MLVHKIYLIVWLELDSNLFEFKRLSLSLEKKKEKELSLSLGRFLSLRPTLLFSPVRGRSSPPPPPCARPSYARGPAAPAHASLSLW